MNTISKQDIQAMKQASRVGFYHSEGASYIRCIRGIKEGPFETEAEYRIACSDGYGYPSCYSTSGEGYTAYHFESSLSYKETWQTIISLLREGMSIRLIWGENGNGYYQQSGLYLDQLHIELSKPDGKTLTFLFAVSICPNNTARMIKPA